MELKTMTDRVLFRLSPCLLALGLTVPLATAASPVLYFSDLTWGPRTGFEGSAQRGAAVTVWGANLGSTRDSSYITVNGARLTADTDYAEWGFIGPARGLQRITFWLNSGCSDGPGSIIVTVNGLDSNALPFTVSAGTIYFVATDGDNGNDGRYANFRGAGSGPFRDIYKFGFQ